MTIEEAPGNRMRVIPDSGLTITKITVRKLVSGDSFSHHAIEAEAVVGVTDDPIEVHQALAQWVDHRLHIEQETPRLEAHLHRLREEVVRMEQQRDLMRIAVGRGNAIIASHERLRELCVKAGFELPEPGLGLGDDDIPF